MAYFLMFIVSFGTGFVLDNAGKFPGALFIGIFFPLLFLFFKQSKGILEMFDEGKIINITKFWLGMMLIAALGLFLERVTFSLLLLQ